MARPHLGSRDPPALHVRPGPGRRHHPRPAPRPGFPQGPARDVRRCVRPAKPLRRVEAALLIHPEPAYASHASAARVYGLPVPKELTEEHVTVFLRQDRRNRRGVRSHLAPASGSTTRLSRIRLSTPAQLLTEMATLLNLVDLVVLGDDMVRRKLVTPEDLVRAGPSTSTATSRTMRNGQSARRSPSRSRPPSSRLQPRFRVGVNTGPDTVSVLGTGGGHTHTVIGDTVNTASRIEGKAPPGGVAIGPGTKDELPGARTAPLGRLELKGKAEPVEAHLLLGLG